MSEMEIQSESTRKIDVNATDDHLEELKTRLRGSLLHRKRGEARGLLKQLIAMTEAEDDRRNLAELLDGVRGDIDDYVKNHGIIRDRLIAELDSAVPEWRTFSDDFEVLRLAVDGLPFHESPELAHWAAKLPARIKAGEVEAVVEEWGKAGSPNSSVSASMAYVLDKLTVHRGAERKNDWNTALAVLKALEACDGNEGLRPGLSDDVRCRRNRAKCELLVSRSNAISLRPLEKELRKELHVELFTASSGLTPLVDREPWAKDLLERVKTALTKSEGAALTNPKETGSLTTVFGVVGSLALIGIVLFLLWLLQTP